MPFDRLQSSGEGKEKTQKIEHGLFNELVKDSHSISLFCIQYIAAFSRYLLLIPFKIINLCFLHFCLHENKTLSGGSGYLRRRGSKYSTAAETEDPIEPSLKVQYTQLLIDGHFLNAASGESFVFLGIKNHLRHEVCFNFIMKKK